MQEDASKDWFFSFSPLFLSLKQIASISATQTHSLTGNWLEKNRCLKTGMYCLSLKDIGVCLPICGYGLVMRVSMLLRLDEIGFLF